MDICWASVLEYLGSGMPSPARLSASAGQQPLAGAARGDGRWRVPVPEKKHGQGTERHDVLGPEPKHWVCL